MARQVKFGNLKKGMYHIYRRNKKELDKLDDTLMSRNGLSERAIDEIDFMRDQLILRMNDCIED